MKHLKQVPDNIYIENSSTSLYLTAASLSLSAYIITVSAWAGPISTGVVAPGGVLDDFANHQYHHHHHHHQ